MKFFHDLPFIFLGTILIYVTFWGLQKLWNLLKESLKTYYQVRSLVPHKGEVLSTQESLRKAYPRFLETDGAVIEVRHGLFWRRSAIYGLQHPSGLKISRTGPKSDDPSQPQRVELEITERVEMPVEQAVVFVNTHRSFLVMRNEIDELKQKFDARARRADHICEAIATIHKRLDAGRKDRYRSKVVAEIREDLEVILNSYMTKPLSDEDVRVWESHFRICRESDTNRLSDS